MSLIALHPQLEADSVSVAMLDLCEVRLITDANYPWLILVPQRDNIREIHRLSAEDQALLMRETSFVAEKLEELVGAVKMNVAALGNMVPQLHIHIVARFESDAAWPGPVWGAVPKKAYTEGGLADLLTAIRGVLTP